MTVLSLFDGMSCGQIALERAGIKVDKYFASEIDKHAIKVTQANYPNTIQLGDVTKVKGSDLPKIDLLMGGSPCQGFSFAGKQLNFEDPRSKLFFEYVRLLKECKPRYFLLENVVMKKEFKEIISKEMGVEPILINSALVSAQNRKRLYWTNIPGVTLPEDKKFFLKDVLFDCREGEIPLTNNNLEKIKSNCIRVGGRGSGIKDKHNWDTIRIGQIGKGGQGQRIYSIDGKSVNLTANGAGLYLVNEIVIKLTPIECERLQTVNTIYEIEVELCLDQIKNYVNAVEKSHKLQKLVSSVEKNELIEFAKLAVKNIQANNPQIKHIALQSVDILILKIINKCTNHNQEEKNIIVDFAEKKTMCNYQGLEGDFVIQNVFTNIIQEKIINSGKAELHLKDKNSCYLSSGRKQLKLYGNEIMQLVEIVGTFSENQETGKCTYTTLYHLNIKNIEQMLIILYWYAKIVIDLYTQIEIPEKNILLNYSFENSYTNHVSNSQRYKMLSNGWTVDVIAHILKRLNNNNKKESPI